MELLRYDELRQRPIGMVAQAATRGAVGLGFLELAPPTTLYEATGIGFGAIALFKLGEAAIEKFAPTEMQPRE